MQHRLTCTSGAAVITAASETGVTTSLLSSHTSTSSGAPACTLTAWGHVQPPSLPTFAWWHVAWRQPPPAYSAGQAGQSDIRQHPGTCFCLPRPLMKGAMSNRAAPQLAVRRDVMC